MKILETQARLGTRYRTKTNKTKHQQLKGCATQVHLIGGEPIYFIIV
jgi:hypothetical protein